LRSFTPLGCNTFTPLEKYKSRVLTLVDEFFEDTELVLLSKSSQLK